MIVWPGCVCGPTETQFEIALARARLGPPGTGVVSLYTAPPAAELTRLRERNAELERNDADWRRVSINQGNELYARGVRISSLEATARELREALEEITECGSLCMSDDPDCVIKIARAALASSESVVGKSEGGNDGVE